MGRSRVVERDLGWAEVKARFAEMKGAGVKVGVLSSAPQHEGEGGPLNMAELASVHEYGSTDGRIPERPFIRSAIDEQTNAIKDVANRAAQRVLDGRSEPRQGLGIVGEFARAKIQQKLVSGPFTPLAESTREKRLERLSGAGKHVDPGEGMKPLIDTGQLRKSISYEIVFKGAGATMGRDAVQDQNKRERDANR